MVCERPIGLRLKVYISGINDVLTMYKRYFKEISVQRYKDFFVRSIDMRKYA